MEIEPQENVYRVYIDSTIPSYLVSRPSRVLRTAKWQRITREFWHDYRFEFVLSDLVIAEISIGDRSQVEDRLHVVEDLTVVDALDLERAFAQQLVVGRAIPETALPDAVHVAVTAIHAIPYLATWNFAHLANPRTRPKIEQICREAGYVPPLHRISTSDNGGTPMNDKILKECQQAKERLSVLFGDVDTLMDFMMKRREQRIKQGVKYADFSPYRKKKQEKSEA